MTPSTGFDHISDYFPPPLSSVQTSSVHARWEGHFFSVHCLHLERGGQAGPTSDPMAFPEQTV